MSVSRNLWSAINAIYVYIHILLALVQKFQVKLLLEMFVMEWIKMVIDRM